MEVFKEYVETKTPQARELVCNKIIELIADLIFLCYVIVTSVVNSVNKEKV